MLPLLLTYSHFSFLQAVPAPAELVQRAAQVGYQEVALTDVDSLHGLVEFVREAQRVGVRPLVGATVNFGSLGYLTLLLKREASLAPLVRAVNQATLQGEASIDCLGQELVVLAGQESALQRLPDKEALELAKKLGRHCNLFLAIPLDKSKWARLRDLAVTANLPVAACPGIRWVLPQQQLAYQGLSRISQRSFPQDQGGLLSPGDMKTAFKDWPQAIKGAKEVAQQTGGDVPLGKIYLPRFGENDVDFLRNLCWRGLERRYAKRTHDAKSRLEMELGVIEKMGFSSYFLIAWDLVRFARGQGIAVGPGRGSAGGSIVSYLLDITRVDPLIHNLYFERFLNPGRVSMPDIDMDFCYLRRDEVFAYAIERYGRNRTCQIATYSTFGPRGSLRDAGRALGLPRREVDALCRRVPSHGSLESIIQENSQLAAQARRQPWQRWFSLAAQLEGRVRHTSVHPGALLITPFPLDDLVPLMRSTGGDICSQWDKDGVEDMGLLKMDLLAVRGLSVNQQVVTQVGRDNVARGYSTNDPATVRLLQQGRTLGCFQLESEGMRSLLKRLNPKGLEDVIAVLSLYRPGPWQAGMVERYIQRRHGREEIDCWHTDLEPVLKDTYGVLLYQEQVMQVAQVIAGYSAGEADMLRRAMTKLKRDQMEDLTREFCQRAKKRGYNPDLAKRLMHILVEFSGYAFNRAHSAAYGHLALATVYLKAHWPDRFCAALLSTRMGYYPPQSYVHEATRLGIKVLPPCINKSQSTTQVEAPGVIRLGLDYVKGLGADARRLVQARGTREFRDLGDFLARCSPGAFLRGLVQAGALDVLEPNRRKLLAALPGMTASKPKDMLDCIQETQAVWLPDLPDLTHQQRVAGQFASLELVLDQEWLKKQQPPWDLPRVTAADILNMSSGRHVTLAAAVVNRRYGNITLDDFSNQVQAKFTGHIPALWVWAKGKTWKGRLEEVELRPLEGVLAK